MNKKGVHMDEDTDSLLEKARALVGDGLGSPQWDVDWGERSAVVPLKVLDIVMAALEHATIHAVERKDPTNIYYAAANRAIIPYFPETEIE